MSLTPQSVFNDFFKGSRDNQRFELSSATVEYITLVCRHLGYSSDMEFTIFETLRAYFDKHFEVACKKYKPTNPHESHWTSFLENLENEVLLKTFNVVMLCVKYLSRETAVPLDKILYMLNCAGYQCDVGKLKESEFEVFNVLEFKITKSILYEMVTLIGFCFEDKSEAFSNVAHDCLRIVYSEMEKIRGKFSPENDSGSYFEKLLCAGVVLYSTNACNMEKRLQNKLIEFFGLSKSGFIKITEIFNEIISEKCDNYVGFF